MAKNENDTTSWDEIFDEIEDDYEPSVEVMNALMELELAVHTIAFYFKTRAFLESVSEKIREKYEGKAAEENEEIEDHTDFDDEEEMVPAPDVIVFDTDRHMKIINIDDCFAEVPWFGDSNILIHVPDSDGLFLTCQKENLMYAGEKEYLVGQAVVMRVDENRDPLSVTLEDGMNVCRIMDQRMSVLVNDRTKEKKKAFCLS